MELRAYGALLRRRWWIIVLLPVLVGLFSLPVLLQRAPVSYVATASFAVNALRQPSNGNFYTYDGYYAELTSEYLVDDFAELMKGSEFAAAVSQQLQVSGSSQVLSPGMVQSSTQTGRLHRILTVSISAPSAEQAQALIDAVGTTLDRQGSRFFAALDASPAQARLVNGPSITAVVPSTRARLDFAIRLTLGLLAGLGLAFLVDYLDDRVRVAGDLEKLGIPVLAEIPPAWPAPPDRPRI